MKLLFLFFLTFNILLFFSVSWPVYPEQTDDKSLEDKYLRLQKELQFRYKNAYSKSSRPKSRIDKIDKIMRGWNLFNGYCRFCHGFSEQPGKPSEMKLSPPLSDSGKLSKTIHEFLKIIYFGKNFMPAFGMGAFEGKIVADRKGYSEIGWSKRLTPEQVVDIAYYLQFCYSFPEAITWRREDGKPELNFKNLQSP